MESPPEIVIPHMQYTTDIMHALNEVPHIISSQRKKKKFLKGFREFKIRLFIHKYCFPIERISERSITRSCSLGFDWFEGVRYLGIVMCLSKKTPVINQPRFLKRMRKSVRFVI